MVLGHPPQSGVGPGELGQEPGNSVLELTSVTVV